MHKKLLGMEKRNKVTLKIALNAVYHFGFTIDNFPTQQKRLVLLFSMEEVPVEKHDTGVILRMNTQYLVRNPQHNQGIPGF